MEAKRSHHTSTTIVEMDENLGTQRFSSLASLAQRYRKVINGIDGDMNRCEYVYRNTEKEVFDCMMEENMMETRPMDVRKYFGSPLSPARTVNMPHGLFFCANVSYCGDRFGLPKGSPYGNIRLMAPVCALLSIDTTNLYFFGFLQFKSCFCAFTM